MLCFPGQGRDGGPVGCVPPWDQHLIIYNSFPKRQRHLQPLASPLSSPAASAARTSMCLVRQALHLRKTRSKHNYPSEKCTGPALIRELLPPLDCHAAAAEVLDQRSRRSSLAKQGQAGPGRARSHRGTLGPGCEKLEASSGPSKQRAQLLSSHSSSSKLAPNCPSVCVCVCVYACECVCVIRAMLTAYGGSQARGIIRDTATSLNRSHSNVGSELCLGPTPQLTATPDP